MGRWSVGVIAALELGCGGSIREGEPATRGEGGSGGVPQTAGGALMNAGQSAIAEGGTLAAAGAFVGAGAPATLEGGAGPVDPCDGVDAWCSPGEMVCDPRVGRLTLCSECGAALPNGSGAECVRIIASDKESNGVCVVRGATALECWPGWGEPLVGQVSALTNQVLVPDDFASLSSRDLSFCTRLEGGKYSCLSSAVDCSRGAAADAGFCVVCGGQLHCEEGAIVQPPTLDLPIVDIGVADMSVAVLSQNDVRVLTAVLPLPPTWQGTPTELLVDHQLAGCVRTSRDELGCWQGPAAAIQDLPRRAVSKLALTTLPHGCVLDSRGQVACGNLLADAPLEPLGGPGMVDVVASSTQVCALSSAGRVSCWKDGQALELPTGW